MAQLSLGVAPFYEPALDDLLAELAHSGRLRFTTDMAAARGSEVHFICVGTPQKRGENGADLRYVDAAVAALAAQLSPGDVVAGKSTVPVGTAQLGRVWQNRGRRSLVWNPEFLREGHAVADTVNPDRFVYGSPDGSEDHPAVAILDRVYATPLAAVLPGSCSTTPRRSS